MERVLRPVDKAVQDGSLTVIRGRMDSLRVVTSESQNPNQENGDITFKPQRFSPGGNVIDARRMFRRRGRSGCRCHGEEKSSGCRSRSCRNKNQEAGTTLRRQSREMSQRPLRQKLVSSTEKSKAA